MAMADWLYSKIVVGPLRGLPSSAISFLSHIDSSAALVSATYSTHSCYLILHDTSSLFFWNG